MPLERLAEINFSEGLNFSFLFSFEHFDKILGIKLRIFQRITCTFAIQLKQKFFLTLFSNCFKIN
jgi:hypothetical protein